MGGRGSGGGKTGGGGGSAAKKETQKTQLKSEPKEQPKEKTLQEKRLEAIAKARAKRAENLKNGIKKQKSETQKTKSIPSDNKISEMVKKIAPDSRGWSWESNGKEITVRFKDARKVKNSTWNKLIKKLGEVGISDVMISND